MNAARRRLRLAASIAAVLGFASGPALADMTKDQCIEANVKGQELRRDGKLAAASEQLRACISSSCPGIVRDDCTKRLDELEKAQPTIAFEVKDAAGADLIDVRVSVDGQPLLDHLDGKPVNVDPGAHVFTFEVAGKPPVTERLLVREGEAARRERVVVGNAAAAAAPLPPKPVTAPAPVPPPPPAPTESVVAPPASPPPESSGPGAQKVIGATMAGVGLVGLGVGTAFGLMASSAWSNAKSACGGNVSQCTNVPSGTTYHGTTETDGTISTIGFVAGGLLVAGGVVLFLTGGRHEGSPATGVVVAPSVGPNFASLSMSGAF
jgi:hypothetical protein